MLTHCVVTLTALEIWVTVMVGPAVSRFCQPEAWEGESYTVNCSDPSGRGSYAWTVFKAGLLNFTCKAAPGSTPCPDGRITAGLNGRRSQTNLTFHPVKATDRNTSVTCTSFLTYRPFNDNVISCVLRVLSKPLSTSCAVNKKSASVFQLRCTAVRVFPSVVCNITLTKDGVSVNQDAIKFNYETSETLTNGDEYRTVSCSVDFKDLTPGNYAGTVVVCVASASSGGIAQVKECHHDVFQISVPRLVLKEKGAGRCLASDQTTLAVELTCEARDFSDPPNVTWFKNGSKVMLKKRNDERRESAGRFNVTSFYKFQPSQSDGSTDVTCTAQGATETATASFSIPGYPASPPVFSNSTGGVLVLNEGHADIECRIPGVEGRAFNKMRIRCLVNGAAILVPPPQPGGLARVRIKDTRRLDQASCSCTADHSFFCYTLVAMVVIRVGGNAPDLDKTAGEEVLSSASNDGRGYKIAYIALATACLVLIVFVLGLGFSVAHKKFKRLFGRDSTRCHYVNDHVYCDLDENLAYSAPRESRHRALNETRVDDASNPLVRDGTTLVKDEPKLERNRSHQRSSLPDVISDSHAVTRYGEDSNLCHSLSSISTSDGSWINASSIGSYINLTQPTGKRSCRIDSVSKSRQKVHNSRSASTVKAHTGYSSSRDIYVTPLPLFSSESFKTKTPTLDSRGNNEKGTDFKILAEEAKSLILERPIQHSLTSSRDLKLRSTKRKYKRKQLTSARKNGVGSKNDDFSVASNSDPNCLELQSLGVVESKGDEDENGSGQVNEVTSAFGELMT